MSVGKRIQLLRKKHNLTQQQLADQLSVSRQAISKWESDFNEPDIRTLIALSYIFEVSVDELVGKEDKKREEDPVVFQDLSEQMLKTNKKNHTLLIFLTSFVIVFILIFLICPMMSYVEFNHTEEIKRQTNISESLEKSKWMVIDFNAELKECNLQEQTIRMSGQLDLQNDFIEEKDKTLIFTYDDQSQAELKIFESPNNDLYENLFMFDQIIPAKNIESMRIKVGKEERDFGKISCPISDYFYGMNLSADVNQRVENQFDVDLTIWLLSNNDRSMEENWEDCIFISTDYIENLQDYVHDLNVKIYKDKELLYDKVIETFVDSIIFDGRYQNNLRLVLTYQTPLNQTYTVECQLNSFTLS